MTGAPRRTGPLDIYLQPAVVGGGLGDIEEVLAVGRRLARAGFRLRLYRSGGRPLPPSVDGPWGWPRVRRLKRIAPAAGRALTVTPWWGVSARPENELSNPAGPWSRETEEIEEAYGRDRVVHLSLEEFARNLTSREQTRERLREGGVASRSIPRRLASPETVREVQIFHEEYRRWRALDRPNVLHLFTAFRPSQGFRREFPEAIQTGPLWPESLSVRRARHKGRYWVWYASPSSSDRLASAMARASTRWSGRPGPLEVEVRSPRPLALPSGPGIRWRTVPPTPPAAWHRRFHQSPLRIVTGSRTLLEALEAGGPFLYFNGVLNRGSRTRRHRPEKIRSLLEVWARHGVSTELCRDLADFSRLRRVPQILWKARGDPRWARRFPHQVASTAFVPPWDDAGALIERWARDWSASDESSDEFVARSRAPTRSIRSRL